MAAWVCLFSGLCQQMKLTARNWKEGNLTRHTQIFKNFSSLLFWISSPNFWNFGLNGLYTGNFTNFLFSRNASNFIVKTLIQSFFYNMRCFVIFATAVCILFLQTFQGSCSAALILCAQRLPPTLPTLKIPNYRHCHVTLGEATSQFQDGADTGWKRSIERTRCSCDKRLYFTAKIK